MEVDRHQAAAGDVLIGVLLDSAMAIWPVAWSMVGTMVQPVPPASSEPR